MKSTMYQAAVNRNRKITTDTEMNSLAKLAPGSAAHDLDGGSGGGGAKTLRHRQVSQDKVVRASHCHHLRRRRLCSGIAIH